MNWGFLLMQLIALVGIISFTIVATYYIRHRHVKAASIVEQQLENETPQGGEFLKRYIPPEHRVDALEAPVRPFFSHKTVFYLASMLVPLFALTFIGSNYYANREVVLQDITLSDGEIASLSLQTHAFEATLNPYATTLTETLAAIPKSIRMAVFHKKGKDSGAINAWKAMFDEHNVSFGTCHQPSLSDCRFRKNSTIILSLDDIASNDVAQLAKKGYNVIAFGVPKKSSNEKTYIPGLKFVNSDSAVHTRLAVVGDSELTLGMDAGTNFEVPTPSASTRAYSERPQAIGMFSDGIAGGDIQTRVFATRIESRYSEQSRIVWMDFTVDHRLYMGGEDKSGFNKLLAGIVRYATEQSYNALATWPNGHQYAAFFEEDTEDGYENARPVSDYFESINVPLTWYVLSDLANDHRALTRKLAKTGEIACHGDNHDIMTRYTMEEQAERLARCMKVVLEITGETPSGFRPPTEVHNTDTFSAMLNVGMTHLFAENTTKTQVPHFKRSSNGTQSLVSIPRAITDDYYLWNELKLNREKSLERMTDELQWIGTARSLFGFSFHTQFMSNPSYFAVVRELAAKISEDNDVYLNTVGDLTQWWRFRDDLINNQVTDDSGYAKYKPVLLSVDDKGALNRTFIQVPQSESIEIADIDFEQ